MKLIVLLIIAIIIVIFYLKNKKLNHEHEINRIETLGKQNHKKIKAQADYKKASKKEKSVVFSLLNQISKMLFTLF